MVGAASALLTTVAGAQTKPPAGTPQSPVKPITTTPLKPATLLPMDQLTLSGNFNGNWHYNVSAFSWTNGETMLKFVTDSAVPSMGNPPPSVGFVSVSVAGYPAKVGTYSTAYGATLGFASMIDVRMMNPGGMHDQYQMRRWPGTSVGNGAVTLTITSANMVNGALVVHGSLDAQAQPNGYSPTPAYEHLTLRF
jgi:hypothetical protein